VNRARFCAAALAGAMVVPAAIVADTPQKIKITVPSYETADGAYLIAVQKGYFAAEGLDPELVFAAAERRRRP